MLEECVVQEVFYTMYDTVLHVYIKTDLNMTKIVFKKIEHLYLS